MSVAWLFPGQGSQSVGMAGAWAVVSTAAADALAEAGEVLGFDLAGLIAGGPAELLSDTYNQQPAILAASVAIWRAAMARQLLPPAAFIAGHSLGELSALVAAGALDYPAALGLVRERGRLMRLAGERAPGSMAAVLGLADDGVQAVCSELDGVQVANYNAPGQVVISGDSGAVAAAAELLKAAGARRVMPLPITIAAHSALMASVIDDWAAAVNAAPITDSAVPMVANLTAVPIHSAADIRGELVGQFTGSVRWTASVAYMTGAGVTSFFEVGPGQVLGGLVKRILADTEPAPTIVSLAEPSA